MLPYGPEAIQGIHTISVPATLGGLGPHTIRPFPPLCPVCEAYGTLPTHTLSKTLYFDGHVGVVNSLAAPLLGSKTELLAQPELEPLTRPFKVRRLTVRPIGGPINNVVIATYYYCSCD